jgi:iron complex outermembrane receptor protein
MKQEDFGLTVGIKGKVAGWNTDLSSTYGRDKAQIGVADSGNVSLFNDTGATRPYSKPAPSSPAS